MSDYTNRPIMTDDMLTLAKRLRSRAHWTCDGYYDDAAESARNWAVRDVYEDIAGELDELFGFSSCLTKEELGRRL